MKKDIQLINYNKNTDTFDFHDDSNVGTVSGRDRLVQEIVKRILTLKGSNYFEEGFGENFYRLFGIVDRGKVEQIKETFPVMVQSLEDSIKTEQAGDQSLKDSEKLQSLDLIDVEFDKEFSSWIVKIRVVTQDLVPITLTL